MLMKNNNADVSLIFLNNSYNKPYEEPNLVLHFQTISPKKLF